MPHVLLLDMAIHTFDAARFLSGADPVAVYCHESNPKRSWYQQDASAVAIFEMSDGSIINYRGSWCAEGLATSWASDWRAIGTKGSVKWDGDDGFSAEVVSKSEGFISEFNQLKLPQFSANDQNRNKVGGHAGLMKEFIDCIQTGQTPETICMDNIKSLAMVLGAIESSQTGRRTEIKI